MERKSGSLQRGQKSDSLREKNFPSNPRRGRRAGEIVCFSSSEEFFNEAVPPKSPARQHPQQGRQDDANRNPDQSWTRDYRDLFALHPDNTFLIKLAYWLNR